ncbi:uncharacterized protein Z520_06590 [Fonsecaea multimorphosa CBS 102226]|uniref:Uncharacterized protein n=1 Tax=Fonsecaea multimorphosa CBS 102226 TaxID=1442371 RepID=A0A0D2JWA9_9EURO|nr:uncharacterized protein Z520_06590 [Fonsecaea multimorphosa CBS 102226]KIX97812.1 hypothetical protein Z520_06590 [Fonsecaea multimorphosa CBS 102226]OAL23582.1 hypothetical protein AYO22_06159 [Fonsecaea multimorphosa]
MTTAVEATELTEQHPPASLQRPKSEFDPCCNAKVTSPFYLYNHDSPRPSFDVKKTGNPVEVAVQDLESGTSNLSPSITQEEKDAAQSPATRDRFRFWKREKQCMTKPKQRGCVWFSRLSPRQRLLVKILIGLLIIGAAVGIAVGVSVKVHGTVYKGNNTTSQIG